MATLGALAAKCAAGLSLELMAGIAGVESGVRPLVVRDAAVVIEVKSVGEGVAVAVGLIDRGRDPGVGLMGLTTAMLTAAGVSLAEAFDPCASLRAAEHAFTAASARAAKRGVEGPSLERAAVQACGGASGNFRQRRSWNRRCARRRQRRRRCLRKNWEVRGQGRQTSGASKCGLWRRRARSRRQPCRVGMCSL